MSSWLNETTSHRCWPARVSVMIRARIFSPDCRRIVSRTPGYSSSKRLRRTSPSDAFMAVSQRTSPSFLAASIRGSACAKQANDSRRPKTALMFMVLRIYTVQAVDFRKQEWEEAMRKVLFIFGELSDTDVDWLAKAGEKANIPAGTVLIPVGARVDHLYILLDGQLQIKAANGTFIAKLESGEVVGEMSLVDPAPTSVSVEVAVDSLLFRVPDTKLRQKLAADTAFASRFYRAICIFLADRLRATTRRMGYGNQ